MATKVQTTQLRQFQEDTVLLDITFHCPSNTRSAKEIRAKTEANEKWLHHRKDLFQSESYDMCHKIQTFTAQWLAKRALPCQLKGYYRFPVTSLPEVLEYLEGQDQALAEAADEFCAEWADLLKQAKAELKELFDAARYPSVAYMRAGISNEYRLIELGVPSASKVGKKINSEEGKKAREMWDEEVEVVRYALRAEMLKLVKHLATKLRPDPSGKKTILREAAVENTLEWLELFNKRNVLEDDELKKLVDQAKQTLTGLDVVALRKNGDAKDQLARQMDKAVDTLNTLMVNKPARLIKFDD